VLAAVVVALAAPAAGGPTPESVLRIDRNKNRNQVHYGVRVDEACRPVGDSPLYNYWLRLEDPTPATQPLKFYQQAAYGFQSQTVREDGRVEARLRALPDRLLTVRTAMVDGVCTASAWLLIDGREALVEKVFVFADEGFFLPTVRYIEIYGRVDSNGGHAVYEKITVDD
jgi:hypothetical protein